MSRPYTPEEVREMFLENVRHLCHYWAGVERDSVQEKLEGMAFSLLNMFDGTSVSMPAMDIVLRPHPDDKQFHEQQGDNYFQDGQVINDCYLHEEFHK